jgi:hypothetical protein
MIVYRVTIAQGVSVVTSSGALDPRVDACMREALARTVEARVRDASHSSPRRADGLTHVLVPFTIEGGQIRYGSHDETRR